MFNVLNRALHPLLVKLLHTLLFASLFALSGCKDKLELHTRLSESDANEVIAALVENNISATKQNTKDGVTVFIDDSDIARSVRVLKERGLPRKNKTSMGEVFQKEGIISSPLEERARYIYALSQELEYTFSQIAGVIVARVHVVLPEKVAPGEPIQPSSAAVFIKHQPSLDPDVALPKIKRMVASSIPGLSDASSDSIAVVFMPTNSAPQQPSPPPAQVVGHDSAYKAPTPSSKSDTSYYSLNIAIAVLIFLVLAAITVIRNAFKPKSVNTKKSGNPFETEDT